jgi:hypothetical protein
MAKPALRLDGNCDPAKIIERWGFAPDPIALTRDCKELKIKGVKGS